MQRMNGGLRTLLGALMLVVGAGCSGSGGSAEVAPQAVRQAVTSGPDLAVTSVTTPASVQMGQQFTVTATVCNQGTQIAGAPAEVYLSTDNVITPNSPSAPSPDTFVGSLSVPSLSPGQCQTVSLQGWASVPSEGAYYPGVVVDPQNNLIETNETNNTKVGTRMGVGNKPDFVVSAVTGPSSVQMGQQLSATVTVCNQGTQAGGAPVEVYLSSDTVITPNSPSSPSPDTFVGSVPSPWLNAGQCQTLTVQGPAYVPAEGAYYLGAVIDPQNNVQELIENNNTKAGSRIGVGNKPDFVVSAVTGPASVQMGMGQQFTATVTVCNQGTQAGGSPVEVYLSSDTVITPNTPSSPSSDTFVGSAPSPWLNAGQCGTLTVQGSAYVPSEGAYYLGAVIDPQNNVPELFEDNNTKAGTRMGVGYKPDFVVSAVTGPSSVQMNQQFTVTATVCNQGTQSGSVPVEVYLSSDTVITPNTPSSASPDAFIGYGSASLSPGQCQPVTVQGSVYPSAEGAYYLGAVVDPQNNVPELIDDNNAKAGSRIGVGSKPDFVVTSLTAPSGVQMGQQFTATVTVCNQGTQPGGAPLELYLSSDDVITPNSPSGPSPDSFVNAGNAPWLSAGQCATVTVQGSAYPPAEGTYYLGAVIDPQNNVPELIEDNNTKSIRMGVGNKPDLVVSSVAGPASVQSGQSLTMTVTVCNQGTQAGGSQVEAYLSSDTVITPNSPSSPSPDAYVGSAPSPWLAPGQCGTVTVQGSAYVSTEGAYYLGAVIDPQNNVQELFEDNNAKAGGRIGVGNKPDLMVSSVTGPSSAQPGQSLSVTVTVCNQGTQAGGSQVEVYLSSDNVITPNTPSSPSPDVFVGSAPSPWLAPGQCQTLTVQGSPYVSTEGAYYLGAVIDPQNNVQELIDDNNAKAGSRIGVGNKPDFVVTSLTGPASVQSGQSLSVTVTVCNQGTQSGSAPVEVYLSSDTVITPNSPSGSYPDSLVGGASVPWLNPGMCQTLTVQGWASVPSTGSYYLGAAVDSQNGTQELIEDNNTKLGALIAVTP